MNIPNRASRHQASRWSRVFIDSRHHAISGASLSIRKSSGGLTGSDAYNVAPSEAESRTIPRKPSFIKLSPYKNTRLNEHRFDRVYLSTKSGATSMKHAIQLLLVLLCAV